LHVKQKSFQSIPECVHSDVRISQFSRQTVPDSRSLNGETTVAEFCSRSWSTKLTGLCRAASRYDTDVLTACIKTLLCPKRLCYSLVTVIEQCSNASPEKHSWRIHSFVRYVMYYPLVSPLKVC